MEGSSPNAALGRIEAALERIENAARRHAAGTDELGARHERLKRSVAEALGELDALVESGGG